MNYLRENIRHALAAEYVLGTLRGPARRRFQTLFMQHQLLKETVWKWEQYLNEMGQWVEPAEPSQHVWQQIEQHLGFTDCPPERIAKRDSKYKKSSIMWRSLSALAVAAAVVMAVVWLLSLPRTTPPACGVAIVSDAQASPLWLIEVTHQTVRIRPTDKLMPRNDRDFELWALPDNNEVPVSLGLLAEDKESVRHIPAHLLNTPALKLGVSVETSGGSPQGQPASLFYTAELVRVR